MASLTISPSFIFLDPQGRSAVVKEWEPGYVCVGIPSDQWDAVTLTCHGVEFPVGLRRFSGETRVVADWPRSSAGHYELELRARSTVFRTTWTIQPRKITSDAFRAMLGQLQEDLPASLAVGVQRSGGLTGVRLLPPDETTYSAELLRLRRAVNGTNDRAGLKDVLPRIASDPHQVLALDDVWTKREVARRIDPGRLQQAFFRPNNLTANGQLVRLPEQRVEHEVDVLENRLLKAFYTQVARRIRTLTYVGGSATAGEVKELESTLDRARKQAPFLDDVQDIAHLPRRFSMVLLRRPGYREALEGYLEFRRATVVEFRDPALDSPLDNVPHLFETWCTLVALDALVDAANLAGYQTKAQSMVQRIANQFYVEVLKSGAAAIELLSPNGERSVRFVPQRTFSSGGTPVGSISFTQRPDIAVEIEEASGLTKLVILDPKYKLRSEDLEGDETGGGPKKTDIDTMHSYRDSIRMADGQRLVEYAAILYPGPEVEYGMGLAAIPADPGVPGDLKARLVDLFLTEVFAEDDVTAAV